MKQHKKSQPTDWTTKHISTESFWACVLVCARVQARNIQIGTMLRVLECARVFVCVCVFNVTFDNLFSLWLVLLIRYESYQWIKTIYLNARSSSSQNSCRASAYLLAILTSVSACVCLCVWFFFTSLTRFTVCLYLFSLNLWQLTDLFIGYIRATHVRKWANALTFNSTRYISSKREKKKRKI